MSKDKIEIISALVGTLIVSIFVLGLAHSISTGFAGFWGGLPFWIICFVVLPLAFYDFWDSTIRKKPNGNGDNNA